MNYWNALTQAIEASLLTRQVGSLVFVRLTAALVDDVSGLHNALEASVQAVTDWFGLPPRRVYALGSPDREQMTVGLEFVSGSSALIALTLAHGQPQIDLAVIGNQGVIYHREMIQADPTLSLAFPPSPDNSTISPLMKAIEQSFYVNEPVVISEEAV